jgi:hypothetical protein
VVTAAARAGVLAAALAAAALPGRDNVVGELASLSSAAQRLVVRKDGGGELTVSYDEHTAFLRTRPGATSLEGATAMPPAELAAGDRLLCRGTLDGSGARLSANRVVVMTRGDVEARRQREREDWQRRGIAGVVSAVDPVTHEISVRITQNGALKTVVVGAGAPAVVFRRYAPASVRFSETCPGSFADVATGDQLRVLGNHSADGTRVVAEQIVSGAFRVVRGVVSDVDAAKGKLVVRDGSRGGGLVAVAVGPDTLLRRLPPMMVARLLRAAEGPTAGAEGSGGSSPAGRAAPAASGGGWAGAGRAPDPDEALDRLPPATLAEMSKGDEIAVLGPKQADAVAWPAIKLAVWTLPSWPSGGRGGRGRGEAGPGSADPFSDLLGVGGETPW